MIRTGFTPKKGKEADPGLRGVVPAIGVIIMPPVSVYHQVSTIGHLFSPTILKYQSQASGFIGSPTEPNTFNDFLLVLVTN